MAIVSDLVNPSFETGDFTGWTVGSGWSVQTDNVSQGTYAARQDIGPRTSSDIVQTDWVPISPGTQLSVYCDIHQGDSNNHDAGGHLLVHFFDASENYISTTEGSVVKVGHTYIVSQAHTTAPANAAYVQVGARGYRQGSGQPIWIDNFRWNYVAGRTIEISTPDDGDTYQEGTNILFQVTLTGTNPPVTKVEYKEGATVLAETSTADYSYNINSLAVGVHTITAVATLADGTTITSAPIDITISAIPVVKPTREYKASNAYTYLVANNFFGLGSAIPSTALITGIEVQLSYRLHLLSRSKDVGIEDPNGFNSDIAFDLAPTATFETVLLDQEEGSYTQLGNSASNSVDIENDDFTLAESEISEDMRWVVYEQDALATVTIGSEDNLYGLTPFQAADFFNKSIGVKFYPNINSVPSYSERGDACYRVFIDKMRLRVYFDAGSVEYYFASADKTKVIKGELAAAYVEDGNFETNDASGVLQLTPTLTIMDGTQTWIGDDWTIHAAYPPTDDNQIGLVDVREAEDGVGMAYNGLPSQAAIIDNRSRYEFITANFYGDDALDSIYGVNGVGRGFSYNGDFYYTIQTNTDADKDKPRHVAYHHGHLAMGFNEGRVDISVAGQPYNYDGALGASSWSMGDKVHGLLPLSGTILGVFCSNMIWGLSGTTVDNFATQIISPKMGAIEYTVTDMGFPVYANAYGIYTLSQTQQYGDYLGTPMSKDISPWLRPRLIRKSTSSKEVVCAWPVRSKNQYRLAFSDGYVASMTINAGMQQAPTFSFQQYTIYSEADE